MALRPIPTFALSSLIAYVYLRYLNSRRADVEVADEDKSER